MSKKTSNSSGVGCLTVLTIIFVTLKLLGIEPVSGWSWLYVLSPMLLAMAIGAILGLIIGIIEVIKDDE